MKVDDMAKTQLGDYLFVELRHPDSGRPSADAPSERPVAAPLVRQPAAPRPRFFSADEWSPLKEVIVGRAGRSCFPYIPLAAIANIVPRFNLDVFAKPHNPVPDDIVARAEWELDNFARELVKRGVKVHRPPWIDWVARGGYTGSMMRDGLMVVGSTLFESAYSWGCRRGEIDALHGPMLAEFAAQAGCTVVRAPPVPEPDRIFETGPGDKWAINNSRVAFDVADFTRMGKLVVVHLSNTTNQKGVDWVRDHLPAGYELVVIESCNPQEMHMDACLIPIAPGTALYNPKDVHLEELRRHRPLDLWRLLPPPKDFPLPTSPPPYMCSGALAMNVLMLDEKHVFCYDDDEEMLEFFRRLGLTPIPLPFRHVACLGGSFHCATVDLVREQREEGCS